MLLTTAQRNAIHYVENYAQSLMQKAQSEVNHILAMSDVSPQALQASLSNIAAHARVCAHFHPDRLTTTADNQTVNVVQSLLQSGRYVSQFESRISNGKLDPSAKGERADWENHLFGDHFTQASLPERPKYGALNIAQHADGPCPRFGSCFFVFAPDVTQRSTFSFGDSHLAPPIRGTINHFLPLLAAMLNESFERETCLGLSDIRPKSIINDVLTTLGKCETEVQNAGNLDHYIEAQIHGDLRLADDVTHLVADSSYRGTPIERDLQTLCERYDIVLQWRQGYQLTLSEVPTDFRGPSMPEIAKQIAEFTQQPTLNAHALGQYVNHRYQAVGTASAMDIAAALQPYKLLWHVLVRYGSMYPLCTIPHGFVFDLQP
ncbi:DUF3626 domain-containing protein [Thaumasiovibrio subtropicus]|uniref:DUF3626 domain-containing protein n=1 Tax=Thaumasiovibrio subtropicus TaxID=1891207 RepID=UPI000B35C5FE|nr:DUF3626 domain-containing protein [Thaumasiovibrio subtropicus]